ncbi:MAG TPA: proton-conducting transporter membrane subunit [Anaerolineaceae bacterium]|nr:proton-conducting transporter membrane subunit [Anaerolineaceae bacterium]
MAILEYTGLDWRVAFTAVAGLIWIAALLYARRIPQSAHFAWASFAATGLILAGLWVPSVALHTLLLDLAALVVVALVWEQDSRTGRLYLAAVVAGALLAAVGMALGGLLSASATEPAGAAGKLALALILLGFALKLAIIPFSFWLPALAGSVSPMTLVVVISLLDMAELGELALLRVEAPWLFASAQGVWLALALISMFGGALLALAQTSLRRMLAFSTIDDMGYLILGLAVGTPGGVLGALLGAISHAICKFLLFGAIGVAENDEQRPVTTVDCGLACRYPLAAAAFIAGALGMIGVPPLLGFLGRWRLYLGGIEQGGATLGLAMTVATALALLYYVRAFHQVWLGKPRIEQQSAPQNISVIGTTFVVWIALLILIGLFPALLPGWNVR